MNKNFIPIILLTMLLISCSQHIGTMTGNAQITNEHFRVVNFAVGTSTCNKVLGMGGIRNEAMVLDAKRNLYANYPLESGQALSNVTVDFTKKNFLLYSKEKVTVSAEIIDFKQEKETKQIPTNAILSSKKLYEHKGYYINEEVYVKMGDTYKKCNIEQLLSHKVLLSCQGIDSANMELGYKSLFKIAKNETNIPPLYSVNDYVIILKEIDSKWKKIPGVIKCVGTKHNYIVEYVNSNQKHDVVREEKDIRRP